MGVKIRKRGGKWYVFVNYHGRRKAKCVGASRELAEKVRRQLEARLALGDLALFQDGENTQTFGSYADKWLKGYARVECKTSTADGYEGVIDQYLRPRFGNRRLDQIKRDDIKAMINELIAKELSRNTVRNALCVIRRIFNEAIEAGIVEVNPAARLGRFTRSANGSEIKGISLTPTEVEGFLQAAKDVCPEYYALFLLALRAGLRRGELVAVQWGDIQFGKDEEDGNRFIVVQHNYVRREHTTTKSKKSRRVDMSRELRRVLLELRDKRLLASFLKGKNDISDELVFPTASGTILDPDNLYHRYFQPVLTKAGLRKIRLHDLRHTFGSLLIQSGASIVYVKEQMGHSSIQVTVDIYGHLIPGANVSFVDRLDEAAKPPEKTFKPGSPEEAAEIERVAGLILDGARGDLGEAIKSLHQISSEVENSEQVGPRIHEAIYRLHTSRQAVDTVLQGFEDTRPAQADPVGAFWNVATALVRSAGMENKSPQQNEPASLQSDRETTLQQNATQAQLPKESATEIPSEVIDLIGGGAWTRTTDLRIMRPSL